jgi:hypothetical protein
LTPSSYGNYYINNKPIYKVKNKMFLFHPSRIRDYERERERERDKGFRLVSLYLIFSFAILSGSSLGVAKAWSNPSLSAPNGEPGPIVITLGGTQSSSTAQDRANLGIAASGANSDITSISPSGNLIISPTGYVGIGTTTPTQELTVSGTIYSTTGGFMFSNSSTQVTAGSGISSGLQFLSINSAAPSGYTYTGQTLSINGTTYYVMQKS